jgi:hypothetical protein
MACIKLEARGHLLHKTGGAGIIKLHECTFRNLQELLYLVVTSSDMTSALDLDGDFAKTYDEARSCLLPFFVHYRDLDRLAQLNLKILSKIENVITTNFIRWRHNKINSNNRLDQEETPIPTEPETDLRDLL